MSDARTVLVPDGLEGERVDSAIARLFGLSRTRAADLAAGGGVSVNAANVGKSHRVSAGDMLDIRFVIVQTGDEQRIATATRAVTANAQCVSGIALRRKPREKIGLPEPGVAIAAVDEQQRRLARGARRQPHASFEERLRR